MATTKPLLEVGNAVIGGPGPHTVARQPVRSIEDLLTDILITLRRSAPETSDVPVVEVISTMFAQGAANGAIVYDFDLRNPCQNLIISVPPNITPAFVAQVFAGKGDVPLGNIYISASSTSTVQSPIAFTSFRLVVSSTTANATTAVMITATSEPITG